MSKHISLNDELRRTRLYHRKQKADNIKDSTGWYSLQKDEKTPISKRPDDFKDLKITVFAPTDSKTNIVLRDQNGKTDDTGLTADNSEDMYAVGVYNYTLPGQFFIDNYPEGTNKDIYLRAENTYNGETSNISLAWIRIDALAPSCKLPSDLKKERHLSRILRHIPLPISVNLLI